MVMSAPALAPGGRPYTVTQLIRLVRGAIESALPRAVAVEGEITNFTHHRGSGHMYFALRDGGGLIRCVMFRTENQLLRFRPGDGLKVEAQGLITFYSAQGQLQLMVDALAPAGRGALIAALEALKEKLAREGLFARERKRPLPRFPRAVGIVTSPSGAALRDFVRLIRQRAPGVRILVAPARVQGEGAARSLARAIEIENRHGEADVLIVGRGGGALEDLWAFNEEAVVRAIASSRIPVVSAVGHESDLTLADLAADARAATPSHAAEMVVEETRLVARDVAETGHRLLRLVAGRLRTAERSLASLRRSYAFRRPAHSVRESAQRLDELSSEIRRGLTRRHRRAAERLARVGERLPKALDASRRDAWRDVDRLASRLAAAGRMATPARRARLAGLEGRLAGLGPEQVLKRGYALVRRPDGAVVTGILGLCPEDHLRLDLHDGQVMAQVSEVIPKRPAVGREDTPGGEKSRGTGDE